MKVLLAGYNVDIEVLEELKKAGPGRADVTPETLSASYARISRDPRPIDELRRDARREVEKARKSNSAIIFKMGHHSIAEHAVFNFDLLGVSRLALEEIEHFRLAAYTEKSQRYQQLADDFVVPAEVRGTGVEGLFVKTIKEQNACYHELVGAGIEPEDARYVTSLATQGQVGLTINARNLEYLFRRFASQQSAEVKEIGRQMYKLVEPIAPSIILFTEANPYDQLTYGGIAERVKGWGHGKGRGKGKTVTLVSATKNADEQLIAALVHSTSAQPFKACLKTARSLSGKEKLELVKKCFEHAEFYDRALREFEYIDLTFELVVSAACFGQLKRHRMATQTVQPYDPARGVTIPPKIAESAPGKKFRRVVKKTDRAYEQLLAACPLAAPYVLTNAHRRRVLFKCNVRELYHLSRLREDAHAQWDIQQLSRKMTALAKQAMPLALAFIGGKDAYPDIYAGHFGRKPKAVPQY